MKKLFFLFSVLALVCSASAALGYRQNGEGLYVDDSGNLIEDYWDDAAGIYIVNGVGYAIESAEGGAVSAAPAVSSSDGGMVVSSSDGSQDPTAGMQVNPDGSVTVTSGQIQIEDSSSSQGSGHLTQEEWEARWAKYTAANGTTTGTVYLDEAGEAHPTEIVHLGLGRSTIRLEGEREERIVPTSSLRWDTEAPENQVLAVATPTKQTYLTLRAKKSQKAFVMGHCEKCTVLRVISIGKTWTMVDQEGVRGYVLTAGLTFYDNAPKIYAAGLITVNGKTPRGNTVHVRSSNKNTARQIAEYPVGTPIAVFAQDEKWSEVDVGGYHCYILSKFVTLQEPLLVAETATEPAT